MPRHPFLPLVLLALAPAGAAQDEPAFDRDVRPILARNCFACHGPDAAKRAAGLRLDTREGATAVRGWKLPAVTPGRLDQSLLWQRVTAEEAERRMPPVDSGRRLGTAELDVLKRWIESGAPWQEHWAFRPPVEPPVPAPTRAQDAEHPVDRFVLQRLEREGLALSSPADRTTWLRRVHLDLTGLPPAPETVAAFLRDERPDARERSVDRLLADPAFGEHQARTWLDAARFGDTHGLHLDNYREMWPYRDWVIRAFNANLGYDRFLVEQLAGDLLEDATLDQIIASGFNRCHVTTNEGGSIEEEVYVRNVTDRVSTFGTVTMGLTVGCAACHEHKFDPIPQREFYELFAFFNNLDGSPMDGNLQDPPPIVRVPRPEQEARLAELAQRRQAIEADLRRVLAEVAYEEPPPASAAHPRVETTWVDDAYPEGATPFGAPFSWTEDPVHSGERAMRLEARGLAQHGFENADRKLRVGEGDVFHAWVHLPSANPPREIMLQWNATGDGPGWRHRAYWGENLIDWGADGTEERRAFGALPATDTWVRLDVPLIDVGLRPGMVIHGLAFTQWDGTVIWDAAGVTSATPQEPVDFVWIDDDLPAGARAQGDGRTWTWVSGPEHPVLSGTRSLRRSQGQGLNQDFFTQASPPLRLHRGDVLFAHVWLDPADPPRAIQLQWNDGSWEHRVRWGVEAHGAGRAQGADHRAGELPEAGRWVRLEARLDEVGLRPGAALNGWAFTQVGGTVFWDRAGVRTWAPPDARHLRSLQAWEQVARDDRSVPEALRAILATPREARAAEDQSALREHYLHRVYEGTRALVAPFDVELQAIDAETRTVRDAVPTTLVMKERATPRDAYLLQRGQYDVKGARVERRTPAFLPPMADDLPRDRRGLARWLVDPGHPLTARVAVNRFWQQLFGVGLVKTSEDFGTQGERPSHPALLDWLAVRFVAEGWNVKELLRGLTLSATYGQSSRVPDALWRRDPENRLLARGPRFRLDAEVIRDQALCAAGMLVRHLGGPSVKPPQPDGLWIAVAYPSSTTARFQKDVGADKVYRRTLYTFLKRTAPAPQLAILDAPNRESCVMRRERTNTPLQALMLLNDPQYVEAARGFAERLLVRGGDGDDERLRFAFLIATAREPRDGELDTLRALLAEAREAFRDDAPGARALAAVGESRPLADLEPRELASWTVVGSALLNLDEVVTKG